MRLIISCKCTFLCNGRVNPNNMPAISEVQFNAVLDIFTLKFFFKSLHFTVFLTVLLGSQILWLLNNLMNCRDDLILFESASTLAGVQP